MKNTLCGKELTFGDECQIQMIEYQKIEDKCYSIPELKDLLIQYKEMDEDDKDEDEIVNEIFTLAEEYSIKYSDIKQLL